MSQGGLCIEGWLSVECRGPRIRCQRGISDNRANADHLLCIGEVFFVRNIVIVAQLLDCVQRFATLWTAAHQASLYTPE